MSKEPETNGGKLLLRGVNGMPRTSSITKKVLSKGGIYAVVHLSYSHNLAPCNICLFLTIKRDLRGSRFDDVNGFPVVVRESIQNNPS